MVGLTHGLKVFQRQNLQIAGVQSGGIVTSQRIQVGTFGNQDSFGFGIGFCKPGSHGAEKQAQAGEKFNAEFDKLPSCFHGSLRFKWRIPSSAATMTSLARLRKRPCSTMPARSFSLAAMPFGSVIFPKLASRMKLF